jgi:LytR cell envelope-related transcriptional attenuator
MTEQDLTQGPQGSQGPSADERWRKHRLRQMLVFVTLPGVLLGTATVSTAYSQGWLTPEPPKPACQPEVVPAPKRSSFTVNVLNATGKDGMAASVAKGLSQRKFTVGGISNAPETWFVTQSAVIHHGPSSLDQALLLQQQIPGSELFEDEGRASKSVDVVVGLGYTDMVPLPPRFDPLPREITLNVYNTTFRTGLASVVAKDFKRRGFKVKDVSNDPLKTLQMGTALIRYGEEGDLAAKIVAQHVPQATLLKDDRAGTKVDVVIGNAYTALVPQAEVPAPAPRPKQETPTVARPCS